MKTLFHHPLLIYCIAGFASLCIMIIVDYILGAEAEHLNAWVIVNKLLGMHTGIGESLAFQHLGLVGATLLMLLSNAIFGFILIQLIKIFIRIIHS
ncbi:hypothetical protein [Arenibacter sp. F20364]|uniref:hypothetical protein n=1 Tax=Arenibacter sp. F20364 TaxID=2926415 RepID=UPI001FF41B1A|nr:hypothetical protein [Arenibacter sp. F20364]MCK0190293.1 hypothetical protein [Arenibacter sp. F20364]